MAQKAYSRVLSDYEHADDFLRKSLHLNNEFSTKKFNNAVVAVASVEMMTERVIGKNTLDSTAYRMPQYKTDESRVALRKRIFDELSQKSDWLMTKKSLLEREALYLILH